MYVISYWIYSKNQSKELQMSRQEPKEGLYECDREGFRDTEGDRAALEYCSDVGLVLDKCL